MALSLNGSTGISGINGSAGTPALQGGDADTGIFFGTDTASIATAGANRLHITSTGLIGVGTSSPAGGFHVDAASGVDGPVFDSGGTANTDHALLVRDSSNNQLLRVNNNGNIGINNTAPRGLVHIGADLSAGASDAAAINLKQTSTTAATGIYLERSGERKGYAIYVGGGQDSLNFQRNNSGVKSDVMSMTRDGFVGIGTNGPASILHTSVNTPDGVGIYIENRADTGSDDKIGVAFALRRAGGYQFHLTRIRAVKENTWTTAPTTINSQLRFNVMREESTAERLRIESGGIIRTFMTGSSGRFHLATNQAAGSTILLNCVHSRTGIDAGGTAAMRIYADGDVENTNNSYTALSDEKLKENIVDANSQWEDIKSLRVRNFNFKAETGISTHTQIGVIAQEVELVSPGLVKDRPATTEEGEASDETVKSINSSVLYMKAVKALQEAMERIETLEQRLSDAGID